jgi:hypothetical protein
MTDKFDSEEISLMCGYCTSCRGTLLGHFRIELRKTFCPNKRAVYESVIIKLKSITDEDFAKIGLNNTDNFTDGEV